MFAWLQRKTQKLGDWPENAGAVTESGKSRAGVAHAGRKTEQRGFRPGALITSMEMRMQRFTKVKSSLPLTPS